MHAMMLVLLGAVTALTQAKSVSPSPAAEPASEQPVCSPTPSESLTGCDVQVLGDAADARSELVARLVAELAASGFRVTLVKRGVGDPDGLGEQGAAIVVVQQGGLALRVRLVAEQGAERELKVTGGETASMVALRASELIRASLLRVQARERAAAAATATQGPKKPLQPRRP